MLSLVLAINDDLAAARAVFEKNIDAIRRRDRDAYLSLYLKSDRLVRSGPTGFVTGFDDFAGQAGSAWPDSIEALDMRLTPVADGIVYGTYRYRVRYGTEERSGISERLFVKTDDGWKIALTGAVDTPRGTPPPPRAITGATLIDGRGGAPVPNANVVIRNGQIDCAGPPAVCPLPGGIDVFDARGLWITPGLVDAHVHFSQSGWADGRPDALDVRPSHPYEKTVADLEAHPERFARSHLCSGVTSVFDAGGYPWTLRLAERFRGDTLAPNVAAAGPLLSTRDHWLNLPAARQFMFAGDEASARSGVRYLAAAGAKAVKVWYINESEPVIAAAGDEARGQKLPLIVHATELAKAKAALRAGAKLLVHSVWDAPVDEEFIALMKQNDAILNPTLTVSSGYVRMFEAAAARTAPDIDDPNRCVDGATRARVAATASVDPSVAGATRIEERKRRSAQRDALSAANLKRLAEAGVAIATGTDAGNPLTLHGPSIHAEMEAMQRAGMTPMQVIVASTATAARAAGLDGRTGTIVAGKDADLLLVTADPSKDVANFRRTRYVVRAGVLRPVGELSEMARNFQ
ncbi:MAG TPA: amidohydrolase family protein [Thermoanaerobaculia bacterium]|nr:amidohydrolase family protein [Thermoanaerobaculia bacterium]